jgi:uncharacterized membrane protein
MIGPAVTAPRSLAFVNYGYLLLVMLVIALAVLTAYAAKFAVIGDDGAWRAVKAQEFPVLNRIAQALGAYVIVLGAVNLGSVVIQCGFAQCHTFGYRLLQ